MYTSLPSDLLRDIKINIRVKSNQRDLIDRAASLQGKTRSEFMLESACQKAQDVILDRTFFGLDDSQFEQFVELLDASPSPNDELCALLKTKAPWD